MYYKNMESGGRGRPPLGAEKRSTICNIRLEPYINKKLAGLCKTLGISKSEAIRQGILMYLETMDKLMTEKGAHQYD